MNILTNGCSFSHAACDSAQDRLTFLVPGETAEARRWWGRLERGDEVNVDPAGPRVELLDESFNCLASDLRRGDLRLARTGVVYLRIHGVGEAHIRVTRQSSRFLQAG